MKIDTTKFKKYIDDGYINVRKHPTEELYIYNYTNKCQFDKVWTEETMMCRGLILDGEGKIVARPFKKFFNLEEMDKIPDGDYKITDKLDGSLGILYWIGEIPYIATRGSFESKQALKGTELLRKYSTNEINMVSSRYTFLFEIIFSENRIVVDYGKKEELILLAIIENKTGNEPFGLSRDYWKKYGFECVKSFDKLKIDELKNDVRDSAEGFVIKWEDGTRAKVKYDEYVRLHRLVTGVNERRIWDILRNGQSLEELLDRVPDEFYQWVKKTVYSLKELYYNIESDAKSGYQEVKDFVSRKEQAVIVADNYQHVNAVIFKMLDGKDYNDLIWKMIKPKANKPFKEEK